MVGFRDEPTIRFLVPSLTCFSLSLRDLGQSVGTALLRQIPRLQSKFPEGLVQILHPLVLRPGDSDSPLP